MHSFMCHFSKPEQIAHCKVKNTELKQSKQAHLLLRTPAHIHTCMRAHTHTHKECDAIKMSQIS